ncbi:helix-turn-helix domain-containing protein [Phytohabitans kaempferiae]|uniref:Helix-turn-helix domain-containing protein n=1 Tax=Phytohabitans kaempferiae TaxID=1620943 RepID=A0ABV6MDN8_9ACTN
MRALREDRGLTRRFTAEQLGVDYSEVKDLEYGTRTFHQNRLTTLLDLYGVYEHAEREHLVGLARDAFRLPQWEDHFDAPALGVSMLDSLWLESAAERIRCYSAAVVPDLLRTAGYAEAVVRREHGPTLPEEHLTWWMQASKRRQQVLGRTPLRAVIAEIALHRRVGAAVDTLCAQLEHLAAVGRAGSIEVGVLPTEAGYLLGMDSSFTVFDLPQTFLPIAACSQRRDGVAIEDGAAAGWYADAFDRLWAATLPAADSAQLIAELVEQMSVHSRN